MRALVLALTLVATPAAAADQFDLVCSGQYQRSAVAKPQPAERIYRVDLAARTWCIEDCSVVLPIADADTARITFQSFKRRGVEVKHWVDRTSGEVSDIDFTGKCEAAPFTPIPPRKF